MKGLTQPEQETVARSDAYDMIDRFLQNNLNSDSDYAEYSKALDSIYTTPPQRTWVGVTGDEITKCIPCSMFNGDLHATTFALEIEAILKEKNT